MTRTIGTDMAEHLPECPILKPCCDDEQFPEHGFCGNYVGRCLHCMAECICDALRACEERVSRAFHEAGYAAGYGAAMDDGWGEPGHIKEAVAAALDAAREAVSAVLAHEDHCKGQIRNYCNCSRFEALNAIDALSEEKE